MATVRRTLGIALLVVLALALFFGGWLVGRLGIGAVVDPASLTGRWPPNRRTPCSKP